MSDYILAPSVTLAAAQRAVAAALVEAGNLSVEVCVAVTGRYPRFRLVIAAFLQVISLLRLM